jgi:hypothetical protein
MGRHLRAALVIGAVWALAWLPLGALVALYAAGSAPQPDDLLFRPVDLPTFVVVWTVWGGLSGTAFAIILGAAERRHSLKQLSLVRTAVWGALGAMSAPILLTAVDVARGLPGTPVYDWRIPLITIAASAILGGGCAAATLGVARGGRAP